MPSVLRFLRRDDDFDGDDDDRCYSHPDGSHYCYSFWYTEKGIIIKWTILALIFAFFLAWFIGGYIHARKRMKAGKPLLAYHRWLVSYNERRKYGQLPQNHFTFYAAQNPYGPNGQQSAAGDDGTYYQQPPPPMYNGHSDAPPSYYAGAPAGPKPMETYPMEAQQSGVVGSGAGAAPAAGATAHGQEQGQIPSPPLPDRPPQARLAGGISGLLGRFRR